MTPTEMELRVARALKEGTGLLIAPSFWDKCAKIAIRAMREPTQQMLAIAEQQVPQRSRLGLCWQAMIDAVSPPETKP